MEQTLYRIGEASAQLGLQDKNSNTLRSWVEEFKDFLGASANPDPGRPRFFTEDDMRVLRTVRDLRINHLPYSEIKDRLAKGAYAVEQQDASPDDRGDRHAGIDPGMSLIVADQLQALMAPLSQAADQWQALAEQYRSRLEDREERVTMLEQRIDGLQTRIEEMHRESLKQQAEALALAGTAIGARAGSAAPPPAPRKRWLGIF
jgi:DNA-binding transcriptional MerR regulator